MEENTAKSKFNLKTILRIVVVLGLMGFAGWSFFQYQKAQDKVTELSNPDAQKQVAVKEKEEISHRHQALVELEEKLHKNEK